MPPPCEKVALCVLDGAARRVDDQRSMKRSHRFCTCVRVYFGVLNRDKKIGVGTVWLPDVRGATAA